MGLGEDLLREVNRLESAVLAAGAKLDESLEGIPLEELPEEMQLRRIALLALRRQIEQKLQRLTTMKEVDELMELMEQLATQMEWWHQVGEPEIKCCDICGGEIHWIDCPTGGWWAHEVHPRDDHDAEHSLPRPKCWECGSVEGVWADEGDAWTCSKCGAEWYIEEES